MKPVSRKRLIGVSLAMLLGVYWYKQRAKKPSSYEELVGSNSVELLLWFLSRRWRVRVSGHSMLPLLAADDEVLVNKIAYKHRLPKRNEIVVVKDPRRPDSHMIKRVQRVAPDGSVFVVGDNQNHSTDSRDFGWVSAELVVGKVSSRFG